MERSGRRPGLALGYGLAFLGTLLGMVGVTIGSFALLLGGMALFGVSQTSNLLSRYAAADVSGSGQRGRAMGLIRLGLGRGLDRRPELDGAGAARRRRLRCVAAGQRIPDQSCGLRAGGVPDRALPAARPPGVMLAGFAPGTDRVLVILALFLNGVGWNFAFVAGSALLTDALSRAERALIQGLADLVMGMMDAFGYAAGGMILGVWGFTALNARGALLVLGPLAATLLRRPALASLSTPQT